jgi:hypothetical protein
MELVPAAAYATAERLQLCDALFEQGSTADDFQLRDYTLPKLDRAHLQESLHRWIVAIAQAYPLAITVDDVQRLDAPSAGLMAQCAAHSDGAQLCLVLTIEQAVDAQHMPELSVLLQHAQIYELHPLSEAQTTELLCSVFGDVPNLHALGRAIYGVAGGNPKLCLELARHLVDCGTVRYENGHWVLPLRMSASDVPETLGVTLAARVRSLRPLARTLLEAQALASHQHFTREDFNILAPDAESRQVDEAILELIAQGLVNAAGTRYELTHRNWTHLLTSHMPLEAKRERHATIARLYGDSMRAVFHHFAADNPQAGLDLLLRELSIRGDVVDTFTDLAVSAWELGKLFERALLAAEEQHRPPRDSYNLLRWLVALGVVSDDRFYWETAPRLLPKLRELSGVADHARLAHVSDPQARLTQALQQASDRFQATPELQRICPPQDAIRHLATFVATSIPLSARSGKLTMLGSLAEQIEPLLSLSPALRVIYDNALATRELCVFGRVEAARARWIEIYARFESAASGQLAFVEVIRDAIACAIGSLEAQLGLTSALRWAERLDATYFQAVASLELRRLIALQRVDWQGAEFFRKRAEYVSLQQRVRPMFSNLLFIDLEIHASAHDLGGLREVLHRLGRVAAQYPYWKTVELLAEASYERCRGRSEHARALLEQCLRACTPDDDPNRAVQVWPMAVGFYIELLVELDQSDVALALGREALRNAEVRGVLGSAHALIRGLALAEAKSGDFTAANARLEARIAQAEQQGMCNLYLGLLYEARALTAIWHNDLSTFEHFRQLTAKTFNHRERSPLSARYKRLVDEARAHLEGAQHVPTSTVDDADDSQLETRPHRNSTKD